MRLLLLMLVALFLGLAPRHVHAAGGAAEDAAPGPPSAVHKLNVLFIAPFNRDLPAHIAIEEGLDRTLGYRRGAVNAYFEFMDSARLPAGDTDAWLRSLPLTKYATTQFDVVVSYDWPAAISVARNHAVFAAARRLYAGILPARAEELKALDDRAEIVTSHFSDARPLRDAVALTGAGKIYLAGDDRSPVGRIQLAEFRSIVAATPGMPAIEDLSGLRFDDLVARAATLPPGTLIWYTLTFDDGNGGKFRPYDMVARLAEHASVPVFSQWESLLGSGIVGGSMVSSERSGEIIGAAILHTAAPAGDNLRTTYDWRQLERWHLTGGNLIPGATIRFRPPGAWDQFRSEIIGIAAAMAMLGGLLLLLARVAWQRKTVARHLAAERMSLASRVAERTAALTLERRSLADLLAFNAAVLRSSPVAMGVYTASGQCVMVNEALCNLSGLPEPALLAQNLREPGNWQGADLAAACERALAAFVQQRVEIALASPAGKAFWCDCLILPARMQQEQHLLVQFVDLTERKETEARLIEARRTADAANRAKSAFLAMMSHEIRTPMTGVIGMADVLGRTPLDPAQRSYLDIMQASAKTLLTVLNDILDYSKIDADRLVLDSVCFDVAAVALETVLLFRPKAGENGCTLDLDTGQTGRLFVRGDPVRIRQVLTNLVSNAVKFTTDGRIAVRLRHEPADHRLRLIFEVEDTGIGVSAEDLKHLFQPFTQADTGTTRKFGGTGLGLAICKRLVDLMEGEIGAVSHPGAGSVFRFTCLVASAGEDEVVAEAAAAAPATSMAILLADDNPINSMIVRLGLERRQHRVTLVENGAQALAAAALVRYDLILMDMQMPVMDGAEATRSIRALPAPYSDTPIIALTADAAGENQETYMRSGLTDFLVKPIDWGELDRMLARHGPGVRRGIPAPPADDAACEVAVLDGQRLMEARAMFPAGGFATMVADVVPFTRGCVSRLREAMDAANLGDAKAIGHSLRGLFLQLGAPRAAVAAARFEASGDLSAAALAFPGLERAVEEAVVELERNWCDDTVTAEVTPRSGCRT
jgi:PAS domain S-box-containing protein